MKIKKENNIKQFFMRNIYILYLAAAIAIILGYSIDTIMFFDILSPNVLIVHFVVLAIVSISFILGLFKKIEIGNSYLIIVYSTILGLFSAYFLDILQGALITHLLVRNIVVFPLIIFSIGFIVSMRQMLIVGLIIAVIFPILLIASGDSKLIEITPFITTMILISTFALTLFISSMDKSIAKNKANEKKLLKQRNKLKELNKDKENILSVISHDLRGPVGNAKQMMSYLLDNETSDEDKKFLLDAINSNIRSSYNLLNNLLLWAMNERGVMNFEPQNISVYESVKETINFLNKNAEDKSIIIVNNVHMSINSFSDKSLLETIIRNLLTNAIKFTNENGEIFISSRVTNSNLIISIKDNGVGIPEKVQNKLFTNKIITSHGTKNEKGSGLGLKLCKEFTEKNGGEIWVVSEEGKGSEFLFSLPKEKTEGLLVE